MKIITRLEAKNNGYVRYYTGKPCRNGHIAERRTVNGVCYACDNDRVKSRYKMLRDSQKIEQNKVFVFLDG